MLSQCRAPRAPFDRQAGLFKWNYFILNGRLFDYNRAYPRHNFADMSTEAVFIQSNPEWLQIKSVRYVCPLHHFFIPRWYDVYIICPPPVIPLNCAQMLQGIAFQYFSIFQKGKHSWVTLTAALAGRNSTPESYIFIFSLIWRWTIE